MQKKKRFFPPRSLLPYHPKRVHVSDDREKKGKTYPSFVSTRFRNVESLIGSSYHLPPTTTLVRIVNTTNYCIGNITTRYRLDRTRNSRWWYLAPSYVIFSNNHNGNNGSIMIIFIFIIIILITYRVHVQNERITCAQAHTCTNLYRTCDRWIAVITKNK